LIALRSVGQMKLPNFKRLAFVRDADSRILRCEENKCMFVDDDDKELLDVLGNFSASLEEVLLYKLYATDLDVQDLKFLPNVTGITVCADAVKHLTTRKRLQSV